MSMVGTNATFITNQIHYRLNDLFIVIMKFKAMQETFSCPRPLISTIIIRILSFCPLLLFGSLPKWPINSFSFWLLFFCCCVEEEIGFFYEHWKALKIPVNSFFKSIDLNSIPFSTILTRIENWPRRIKLGWVEMKGKENTPKKVASK